MKIKYKKISFFSFLILAGVFSSFIPGDNEFTACNPGKIYAADDYMYKETFFKDFEKVNEFPKYPGGKDSIQAFFEKNVQFAGDETQLVARYHVTCIVNCKGEIGKFELRSKEFPGFEKILNACRTMPHWLPAEKSKEKIDCYVRLGFTNQAGKIKVDYRENNKK